MTTRRLSDLFARFCRCCPIRFPFCLFTVGQQICHVISSADCEVCCLPALASKPTPTSLYNSHSHPLGCFHPSVYLGMPMLLFYQTGEVESYRLEWGIETNFLKDQSKSGFFFLNLNSTHWLELKLLGGEKQIQTDWPENTLELQTFRNLRPTGLLPTSLDMAARGN